MARCDAQEEAPPALEGYINAVHLPNGFEVNGEHVSILPTIHYGRLDDIAVTTTNPDPLRAALQVGVYVRVIGRVDETTHSVMASTIFFRDDWDKPLAGFGLIVKVDSSGAGPILEADGYSIRITAATKTSFGDGLKGLTDVGPGMGLLYEGRRGKDGVLLATAASFSIAHTEARRSNDNQYAIRKKGRTVHADQFLNADGTLKNPDSISIPDSPVQIFGSDPKPRKNEEWVRFRDGAWFKLHFDPATELRINRVGLKLVPSYLRSLPETDPSKLEFRFYAIEVEANHEPVCSADGQVFMPFPAIQRARNEDQLAAALADGVACVLRDQASNSWTSLSNGREPRTSRLGARIANSERLLAPWFGSDPTPDRVSEQTQEEQVRMAIALMADAGYDPWQAPEIWPLLEPKRLPGDLNRTDCPSRTGYLRGVLSLQYRSKAEGWMR